eukprot:TRINITY_DN3134_c0_g1_i1.p1 TRINITY_DN3134_c0_g1~~TRINITY_DN3134_c0_g1_i1.p1  ORF type:complete len:402 (-),score=115.23 TRINITY_DN3134_c0_g1_i1:304-1509(-)
MSHAELAAAAAAVPLDVNDAKWDSLKPLFNRPGPYAPPAFQAGDETLEILNQETKVLVVGAGGLGCEILKDLAISGFKEIHIIDLDTIELSNLNRQFLFREKDIGRFKSEVAAEFVMKRCPGVAVYPYTKRLETFDKNFYRQFNVVIAGLDSVDARRWLNAMLVSLVQVDDEGKVDPSSVIPLIDGACEGWKGQARLFYPRLTSCYECSMSTLPKQREFAGCTIANVPRLPEHCIAYARKILWPRLKFLHGSKEYELDMDKKILDEDDGPVKLDTDNMDHMTWLYERSLERAKEFNIQGVTFNQTMQVVKNIVSAIAAPNALISASCVNEALKAITWCSRSLDNYFMYMGHTGVYANTYRHERLADCVVCGSIPLRLPIDPSAPLQDALNMLMDDTRLYGL